MSSRKSGTSSKNWECQVENQGRQVENQGRQVENQDRQVENQDRQVNLGNKVSFDTHDVV